MGWDNVFLFVAGGATFIYVLQFLIKNPGLLIWYRLPVDCLIAIAATISACIFAHIIVKEAGAIGYAVVVVVFPFAIYWAVRLVTLMEMKNDHELAKTKHCL